MQVCNRPEKGHFTSYRNGLIESEAGLSNRNGLLESEAGLSNRNGLSQVCVTHLHKNYLCEICCMQKFTLRLFLYRSLAKKGPVSNIRPPPLLLQFPAEVLSKVHSKKHPPNSPRVESQQDARLVYSYTENTISKSSLWQLLIILISFSTRLGLPVKFIAWSFESFSWNVRCRALVHLCKLHMHERCRH